MDELDLHGVSHDRARNIIENFLLMHDAPVKVITGNSPTMIGYLKEIAKRHDFTVAPESDYNLGSYIVR